MLNIHKHISLLWSLIILSLVTEAQTISITSLEQNGDFVNIKYSLEAVKNQQEKYDIALYSSIDQYKFEIKLPIDQSKGINPGQDLTLTFNGLQALEGYQGDLNFKILATKTFSPLEFIHPKEQKTVRVGKSVNLIWDGGTIDGLYNLDYTNSLNLNTSIDKNLNQKTYNWTIPEDQAPGTYNLRLSSSSSVSKPIMSGNIVIKKKIPLVIKLAPAAILAAGVGTYFILNSGSESGSEPTGSDIQDPPEPPIN